MTCRSMPFSLSPTQPILWPSDLTINACLAPAMDWNSTDLDVDNSSFFTLKR